MISAADFEHVFGEPAVRQTTIADRMQVAFAPREISGQRPEPAQRPDGAAQQTAA